MARYTIIGNHAVDGVQPGHTIQLPAERARLLMRQGHIAWNQPKAKNPTAAKKRKLENLDETWRDEAVDQEGEG
jgi:hypothetical protein